MVNKKNVKQRKRRHLRIRKKIQGTQQKPRLSVYRGLQNLFVQFIDDKNHRTLLSLSTVDKDVKQKIKYGGNIKAAEILGQMAGQRAKDKGITKIVFDRGGYLYHGRIKTLADSLRKEGLEF